MTGFGFGISVSTVAQRLECASFGGRRQLDPRAFLDLMDLGYPAIGIGSVRGYMLKDIYHRLDLSQHLSHHTAVPRFQQPH